MEEISLATFKSLLHSLKENSISIKVRTHKGWTGDFLLVIGFIASVHDQENKTFGGVVLSNINETEGILINNISTINAFELDHAIEQYQANTVYNLRDNLSLKPIAVD
jgi:hypothetical protein